MISIRTLFPRGPLKWMSHRLGEGLAALPLKAKKWKKMYASSIWKNQWLPHLFCTLFLHQPQRVILDWTSHTVSGANSIIVKQRKFKSYNFPAQGVFGTGFLFKHRIISPKPVKKLYDLFGKVFKQDGLILEAIK